MKHLLKEFVLEVLREDTEKELPKAACVLVVADDGTALAVSRRDDPTMWGLPGGKVDPGEKPIESAKRELEEETGLIASDLKHVFTANDGEYETSTFTCKISGEIDTSESGVIRWIKPEVLLSSASSPFSAYNRKLFAKVGI